MWRSTWRTVFVEGGQLGDLSGAESIRNSMYHCWAALFVRCDKAIIENERRAAMAMDLKDDIS